MVPVEIPWCLGRHNSIAAARIYWAGIRSSDISGVGTAVATATAAAAAAVVRVGRREEHRKYFEVCSI